jgi:hypothetical protein
MESFRLSDLFRAETASTPAQKAAAELFACIVEILLKTPQIIDFRAATGNAPIRIVRPESYGGFYWLGK